MQTDKASLTAQAKDRACPFCGSWKNEPCVRENGTQYGSGKNSFHVERLYGTRETRGGGR